jgi:hypothetical protein
MEPPHDAYDCLWKHRVSHGPAFRWVHWLTFSCQANFLKRISTMTLIQQLEQSMQNMG